MPDKPKRKPRLKKKPSPSVKTLLTVDGRDKTLAKVYQCFLQGTMTATEVNATVKLFKEFRESKDLKEEEAKRKRLKEKTEEVIRRIGKGSISAEEAAELIRSVFLSD